MLSRVIAKNDWDVFLDTVYNITRCIDIWFSHHSTT